MTPPRPLLLCLALPTVALAARLTPWEIASSAAAAMAISAALRRRPREMLGWTGLALGAGLAGLILLPVVIAILIARRTPLRCWPILPATAALLLLPTVPEMPSLAEGVPNLWAVIRLDTLPMLGLACAATIGAGAAYAAQFSVLARHFTAAQLLRMALLAALVEPLLLPGLSLGAFLPAGLLALAGRDPDSTDTAAIVQAGLLLGTVANANGAPALAALGALLLGAAALRVARPLLYRAANDNPILMRI